MSTALSPVAPPGEQWTDEEIVARIVSGDGALFEILMRRHNQRIYRTVRAVLGGDEETEDVMQEAYLSAYQHLGQFEGRAQFSTWLTRIAVNAALARRGKRGVTMGDREGDPLMELVESAAPDPEQETLTSELREVMEREVSALPDAFRTAFVLREVEGLSTSDTAGILGISEDLVKTRLHRARATLRDRLYRRAGIGLDSLFTFGNARCDRVVGAVMSRILTPPPRPA